MEHITITISARTLKTIGAGLQELPFKIADPAIKEIDRQVQSYLAKKGANDGSENSSIGDTGGNSHEADRHYIDQG